MFNSILDKIIIFLFGTITCTQTMETNPKNIKKTKSIINLNKLDDIKDTYDINQYTKDLFRMNNKCIICNKILCSFREKKPLYFMYDHRLCYNCWSTPRE